MKRPSHIIATLGLLIDAHLAFAQCTNHTITVTAGTFPLEVSWQLLDPGGAVVASESAPSTQTVCLPVGCYTMNMFDSFGDGWNGATFTVRVQPSNAIVSAGTLGTGSSGQAQVSIGGGCSPPGCTTYNLQVTGGSFPTEVSWNLVGATSVIASGFAPSLQSICVLPGCFTMQMFDDLGDGWNGATWTLKTTAGVTISSGTLGTGSIGTITFAVGVPPASCTSTGAITASDCAQAVNVCTNINFLIDPNGSGSVNEIPTLGSMGNPDLLQGDFVTSNWGTDNWGCLRGGELNSTWMVVNIQFGGSLEFIFGGLGTQVGYYDWIMYPYNTATCAQVAANTIAPVRCNWNGVSFGGTGLAATVPASGDPTNYEPPLNVLAGQQYLICFSNWSSVSTSVPLVFGGTAVVSCNSVLPLELLSFEAQAMADMVDLQWTTASETNTSRFDIERSGDMNAWELSGTVQAAGNSSTMTDYGFKDEQPSVDRPYYRLRMLDLDGGFSFSPVRSVFMATDRPTCYPNPNDGTFIVQHIQEGAVVHVLDALGRTIPASFTLTGPTTARIRFEIAEEGIYTVCIEQNGATNTERVLVMRR